jgi:hypothetical protein
MFDQATGDDSLSVEKMNLLNGEYLFGESGK